MYDVELARVVLNQISEALDRIKTRMAAVKNAEYFTGSLEGQERLDGICMLFIAIGEGLKNLDKITGGVLFSRYPEVDWSGFKGFRDVIAHQYFKIDAEQLFWICTQELPPMDEAIKEMLRNIA
ncbi:MAG: DUF86 domain-containing protein [Candidatus Sumerlaeota bacterium]|nr:DUF86 domain-containing protein [Candidatus Sumerlaeota bacterium]